MVNKILEWYAIVLIPLVLVPLFITFVAAAVMVVTQAYRLVVGC